MQFSSPIKWLAKLALLELEIFVPVPLFTSTMYYSSAAANLIVKTFLGSPLWSNGV
jgi:hypothetical protein